MAVLTVDSKQATELAGTTISEEALDLAFPDGEERELKRPLPGFDTIQSALQDFAEGKFVVVLDNEDRENEGDLIMAADKVHPSLTTHEQIKPCLLLQIRKKPQLCALIASFSNQAQHGQRQSREGLEWICSRGNCVGLSPVVYNIHQCVSSLQLHLSRLLKLAARRTHRETQLSFISQSSAS